MATNPQDYMGEANPTRQGERNKLHALTWTYKWGYTTPAILQALLGHQGMGWAAGAIRGGWLKKTPASALDRIKVLTLTGRGLAWIEQRRSSIHRYSELDPHRIATPTIRHNLIAQRVTIQCIRAGEAASYFTEREDGGKSQRNDKQPDVVWVTRERQRIGVEIELTGKWDRRFDDFVAATIAALSPAADGTPARFHNFIVFTTAPGIATRYAQAFEPGMPLRIWRKTSTSDFAVERTIKVPEGIRDKIAFRMITETGELLDASASNG